MTQSVRDWLPIAACADDSVCRALSDVVSSWSSRWFAGAGYAMSPPVVRGLKSPFGASKPEWHSIGAAFIDWNMADGIALARRSLDAPRPHPVTLDTDTVLLRTFADEILDDLGAAIQHKLNFKGDSEALQLATSPLAQSGGLDVHLDDSGNGPRLRIAIPAAHIVPFRKALIGSARTHVANPVRFSETVADANLHFMAVLGDAHISAADLTALAIGDVLVLNSSLSDPITLLSRDGKTHLLVAHVSQSNQCLLLSASA